MNKLTHDPGFILVGVVMFVLALTILVLSLFTLSSYEAQSLTQSHSRQQGGYDAQSGIEMVKSLITTPPNFSLGAAAAAVGSFRIVNAVAIQLRSDGSRDSTGVVTGDGIIIIRVTSLNYGERRTLEAHFKPTTPRDYYKRLFTVANNVAVETDEVLPGPTVITHPADRLILSGTCWQYVDNALSDTLWAAPARTTWSLPHFESTDPVVLPDIPAYIDSASHVPQFTPTREVDPGNPNRRILRFEAHNPNTTSVAYYSAPLVNPVPGSPYSYEEEPGRSIDITVEGTVVWIVPRGVQFHQQVNIRATSGQPAVLIIVAGPNLLNGSDYAIHFQGGVTAVGVPEMHVILVTDARAIIEFANERNTYECRLDRLSVLCRNLDLQGPAAPAGPPPGGDFRLRLSHPLSMDAVIENLYAESTNPLPRPPGTASSLTFIPGSWRSATP